MSLYKRKDTPYYWYKFTLNRRVYTGSTKTENKKLAEKIQADKRQEILESKHFGVTTSKRKTTFKEFTEIYLDQYAKVHKESWKSDDVTAINTFLPFFGSKILEDITMEDIKTYMNTRSKEVLKTTVNHYLTILRSILNKAVEWGYLYKNPSLLVKKFKKIDNKRNRILSKEEFERLMLCADKEIQFTILSALHTGLRKKDLNFKKEKIDCDNRVIHAYQSKVQKPIDVPMNNTLLYIYSTGFIGIPTNFRKRFERAVKEAGIENFVFRDLRKTFSSFLYRLGVDTYTRSVLLGHTSDELIEGMEMTSRYTVHEGGQLLGAVKRLDAYCGFDSEMEWTKQHPKYKNYVTLLLHFPNPTNLSQNVLAVSPSK